MKNGLIGIALILAAVALYCGLQDGEKEDTSSQEDTAANSTPATPPPPQTTIQPQIELPTEEEFAEEEAQPEEEPAPTMSSTMRRAPRNCEGTIDAAAAARVVAQQRPAVRACYERHLKTNNLLQGTLNVRATVGRGGNVEGVAVGGSLQSPEVFSCVRRLAQGWQFPNPSGGCAVVSAPFRLTPQL